MWEETYLKPLIPSLKGTRENKTVIFLRGISGSGKSVLCNFLFKSLGGVEKVVCCSADNFFIKNGVYKFDSNKLPEAHEACINTMEQALQNTSIRFVIVDNTHTQLWHMSKGETIAKAHGASVLVIEIVVPDRTHFVLCQKRQQHSVPELVHLDQWLKWENHPAPFARIPMFVSDEKK